MGLLGWHALILVSIVVIMGIGLWAVIWYLGRGGRSAGKDQRPGNPGPQHTGADSDYTDPR